MSTKANNSSVDSGAGMELAALGNMKKAQMGGSFQQKDLKQEEQVVNARKAANVALEKAKKKKKAKMAKASKKKNKK